MRTSCLAAATLLYTSTLGFSATVFSSVNAINSFLTGAPVPVSDQAGTPLESGSASNGDGFLLAIGTTSDTSSTATPDWASFMAISGQGSANHAADNALNTTMGDGANGLDGLFTLGISLNNDDHPEIPQSGQLLVIRFYNGFTIESSTHYNTVTSTHPSWQANTTQNQPGGAASLDMDNDRGQLVWESTPYRTDIPNPDFVPEPSSALLSLLGMALFLRRRR